MRKYKSFISKILFLMFICFLWTESFGGFPAYAQEKDMVLKGFASNQKEEYIKVIDNQKEWAELWSRAFDKPSPSVDFERYVVACVFLGYSADWLYSISLGEPTRRGDSWVIPYSLVELVLELMGPFKARGQYYMRAYEKKTDAKMILEKVEPSLLIK